MKTIFLSLIAILFLSISALTASKVAAVKVKDFITPPPLVEHYAFGLKPQLADFFWVRAIQDLDYCDNEIRNNTCRGMSWLYHVLSTAVNLDPNYLVVYKAGGLALTVLISDYSGASNLFDRGIHQFPNNSQLLFNAAYHALYEEHNFEKAADLYRRTAENGGPDWGKSLGERLKTKEGQIEVGEKLLFQMVQRKEDERIIANVKRKIDELKSRPEAPKK